MFVVWVSGLPGSGKSTIAKKLKSELKSRGIDAYHLQMDQVRRHITPNPKYTDSEREFAYRSLALMASMLSKHTNVIVDGTAYKRSWRDLGRKLCKRFYEVYVDCPIEVCMSRESKRKSNLVMRNIYNKRKKGKNAGKVIGVDIKYQKGKPDIVVKSDEVSPKEAAIAIADKIL